MKTPYAIAIAIVIATLLFPAVLGEYNPMAGSTYIPSNSPGSVISLDNTGFELVSGDFFTVSGKAFAKDPGIYLIKVSSFGVKLYDVKSSSPFNFELDFTMPDNNPLVEHYDVSIMKCDVFEDSKCKYFGIISPSVSQLFRIDNIDTLPSSDDLIITVLTPKGSGGVTSDNILVISGTVSHPNLRDVYTYHKLADGTRVKTDLQLVETVTKDTYTWATNIPLVNDSTNFIYVYAVTATGEHKAEVFYIKHETESGSDDSGIMTYITWFALLLIIFFILLKIKVGKQS